MSYGNSKYKEDDVKYWVDKYIIHIWFGKWAPNLQLTKPEVPYKVHTNRAGSKCSRDHDDSFTKKVTIMFHCKCY